MDKMLDPPENVTYVQGGEMSEAEFVIVFTLVFFGGIALGWCFRDIYCSGKSLKELEFKYKLLDIVREEMDKK